MLNGLPSMALTKLAWRGMDPRQIMPISKMCMLACVCMKHNRQCGLKYMNLIYGIQKLAFHSF